MAGIFPLEIFEAIIDQIWRLKSTDTFHFSWEPESVQRETFHTLIHHCALVSRRWLPRARYRAFGTLSILSHTRSLLPEFGGIVSHPLCTIRDHIRHIELDGHRIAEGFGSLWPYLHYISHLEEVDVHHVDFSVVDYSQWTNFVLPGLFRPTLRVLRVSSCTFFGASELVDCISRCTLVESLLVHFVDVAEPAGEHQAQPPSRPFRQPSQRLTTLDMQYCTSLTVLMLDWLSSGAGVPRLTDLELCSIACSGASSTAHFLRLVGPSVKRLRVTFCDSSSGETDGQDAFCAVADFSTLTNLRFFSFGQLSVYPHYMGRDLSAKHVPLLMAKLVTTQLREIHFHVLMQEPEDLLMIDWDLVVAVLNGPSLPRLETLHLSAIPEAVLDDVAKLMDERLGRHLRRKVTITYSVGYVFFTEI
ncbi:hypothetical protein EXIGLDRAFT_723280 [Exidia glandulosa HHB12029]|uniref:F-box domain-containing protein n=1 Tax=Exidia glandulosa HHB12029 TaxID=1314781 RepID=A0A166A291_EXIGL|nr:hypothetical protein EXIGLDRAFT_723280 [Exidia glandulosa HHB12029]